MHRSFVTYVASVVHVKVNDDGTIRVPEVRTAIDCGFAANPERIRSQIEGAAVMGMTLALNSAVTFKDGRAQQNNYYDYDVVRIDNFPEVVVTHIVEHPFAVHATGSASPGCRRSRRRSTTRSSTRPASGCATCRWATSSRPDAPNPSTPSRRAPRGALLSCDKDGPPCSRRRQTRAATAHGMSSSRGSTAADRGRRWHGN